VTSTLIFTSAGTQEYLYLTSITLTNGRGAAIIILNLFSSILIRVLRKIACRNLFYFFGNPYDNIIRTGSVRRPDGLAIILQLRVLSESRRWVG